MKYLSICWGAIISRLAIARGMVEHNFWPHHFHPIIDYPTALQGHRRTSFVLPNASWNRSPVSAYTFISPSHMDSTSRSPSCRLESRHLPFNVQSERLQSTQSKTYPTGGNDQSPSLRLNATPVLSGSRPSRALFDQQPSVTRSSRVFRTSTKIHQTRLLRLRTITSPLNTSVAQLECTLAKRGNRGI